jgi:hypothetical protein
MNDFSIGNTTGMVSIGGVGNEARVKHAVACSPSRIHMFEMGDTINMAARLMFSPKGN